ncbi:PaaI family thioesterase [soil metagenome]
MNTEPADAVAHADWGPLRSRTVTWHQPGPTTAKGLSMAGIDYIRAVVDGVMPIPPMESQWLLDFVEVEHGRVVVTYTPDESAYNGLGTVHGALLCTLLDVVTGCALHSTLPQGKGYTSIEIKVNYLKPVSARSGLLTATGTVVKSGARVGFGEGVVVDGSGMTVATATSTFLVFDL